MGGNSSSNEKEDEGPIQLDKHTVRITDNTDGEDYILTKRGGSFGTYVTLLEKKENAKGEYLTEISESWLISYCERLLGIHQSANSSKTEEEDESSIGVDTEDEGTEYEDEVDGDGEYDDTTDRGLMSTLAEVNMADFTNLFGSAMDMRNRRQGTGNLFSNDNREGVDVEDESDVGYADRMVRIDDTDLYSNYELYCRTTRSEGYIAAFLEDKRKVDLARYKKIRPKAMEHQTCVEQLLLKIEEPEGIIMGGENNNPLEDPGKIRDIVRQIRKIENDMMEEDLDSNDTGKGKEILYDDENSNDK